MKTEIYSTVYIDYYKKKIFYLIITFLILFVYTLFTYLISYAYNVNSYYVTVLNLLSYVLFIPFVFSILKNKSINLLEPIYIVNGTFYLYFVFAPSTDLIFNNKYFFGTDYFPQLPLATIYVVIGIFMLEMGYYSNFGISVSKTIIKKLFIKNINTSNDSNNKIKAIQYAIFLLIIGIVGFYFYIKTIGGSFILDRCVMFLLEVS